MCGAITVRYKTGFCAHEINTEHTDPVHSSRNNFTLVLFKHVLFVSISYVYMGLCFSSLNRLVLSRPTQYWLGLCNSRLKVDERLNRLIGPGQIIRVFGNRVAALLLLSRVRRHYSRVFFDVENVTFVRDRLDVIVVEMCGLEQSTLKEKRKGKRWLFYIIQFHDFPSTRRERIEKNDIIFLFICHKLPACHWRFVEKLKINKYIYVQTDSPVSIYTLHHLFLYLFWRQTDTQLQSKASLSLQMLLARGEIYSDKHLRLNRVIAARLYLAALGTQHI